MDVDVGTFDCAVDSVTNTQIVCLIANAGTVHQVTNGGTHSGKVAFIVQQSVINPIPHNPRFLVRERDLTKTLREKCKEKNAVNKGTQPGVDTCIQCSCLTPYHTIPTLNHPEKKCF